MSKPFNIHDWQAKQRQQLLNEGVWEIGNKQDIQEFIAKLKQLKNVYYNVVGSDEVQDGLDAALRGAEELMKNAKPGRRYNEHHEEGTFPEVDQKTKDYLDKLEKSDPSAYKAVEDYIKAMGGMDENVTGGGAVVSTGPSGTGPYASTKAFKKNNKEDK